MKNSPLRSFCIFASIGSILAGVALFIAALSPRVTSDWGEVAMGCTPQAMLITGGLIALAICSSCSRDGGAAD